MSELEIQAAVASHALRNHELKKLIKSKGIGLTTTRSIDLQFWAFGEQAASELVAALQAEGYSPVSKTPSADDPTVWSVQTQLDASPLSVTEPSFVEKLVRLAAKSQGEFDGWGTSL